MRDEDTENPKKDSDGREREEEEGSYKCNSVN